MLTSLTICLLAAQYQSDETTKAHSAPISRNMHYSRLSVGREQQQSDMELT